MQKKIMGGEIMSCSISLASIAMKKDCIGRNYLMVNTDYLMMKMGRIFVVKPRSKHEVPSLRL